VDFGFPPGDGALLVSGVQGDLGPVAGDAQVGVLDVDGDDLPGVAGADAQPLARLWHAGNLLREHRGDGHVVALVANGIGGTEAHVLAALSQGMPAEKFGRVWHLPRAQLAAVVDGMRDRGLIGADGWLTADGRTVKARIEALTDDLAAPAYDALDPGELAQLIAGLEPIAATLNATYGAEN
jgi:Helix-turn-helix family